MTAKVPVVADINRNYYVPVLSDRAGVELTMTAAQIDANIAALQKAKEELKPKRLPAGTKVRYAFERDNHYSADEALKLSLGWNKLQIAVVSDNQNALRDDETRVRFLFLQTGRSGEAVYRSNTLVAVE